MSDSIDDMTAYAKLSDWIVMAIQNSSLDEMRPARDLIQRLRRRQLYTLIGEVVLETSQKLNCRAKEREIRSALLKRPRPLQQTSLQLDDNDVVVSVFKIDYGKGFDNPVGSTVFVNKDGWEFGHVTSRMVSNMVPRCFCEYYARVWCKDPAKVEHLRSVYGRWRQESTGQDGSLTPCNGTVPAANKKRSGPTLEVMEALSETGSADAAERMPVRPQTPPLAPQSHDTKRQRT
eukprot:FR740055.1.p1 GENE.FR740055.1~~FR740055.1.p1  ORF type:complete len:265 (+),score=11.47 FR740055.1:97-795(+)